ncbi:MAG: methylated-DNA--[protein]-cysteine S-methyltransferase [Candidatus Micrarchaeota archaeon]
MVSKFERMVLAEACKIPLGETRTYKQIARAIGKPRAFRAVGNALKKNKLPLVVPCHRVVRSDGDVGGYALGKKNKKILLSLERELSQLARR